MAKSCFPARLITIALCVLPFLPGSIAAQNVDSFRMVLSSGPFGLPAEANSVDWVVVNESPDTQAIQVTIWRLSMGYPRAKLSPGTISLRLSPGVATHDANPIGGGTTFQPGYYYEITVAANDRRVLPTVMVWIDRGAHAIPGTRIGPRDFVDVR
jgi:uncharacterized membrane protein YqaE (UPF0057 family)